MKNEKQPIKEKFNAVKLKTIKYFYTIEDFPKFKILEENYQAILDELVSVINKEKQINLKENKIEKFLNSLANGEIYQKADSSAKKNQELYNITDKENLKDTVNSKENKNEGLPHNDRNKANYNDYNLINSSNQISNNDNIINNLGNRNDNDTNKDNLNEKGDNTTNNLNEKIKTFEPWVEKNLYQESNEEGWDVAPLMIGGERIPERWEKFPLLASLVSQISGVVSVSFSLLKPGTHIVPHKGYDDYSEKMFRFHMGLIVPQGDIGIRVESEICKWENGKSFVFDDFMIHEAWNFTPKNRIVLIIDFLKDESKVPEGIKFFDNNFNKSIKGYLKKDSKNNDYNSHKEFESDIDTVVNDDEKNHNDIVNK